MSSFQYYYTTQAIGNFDIENIGEFALSCVNDKYYEYLLIVNTTEGRTKIIQYGPQLIDNETDENCCRSYTYTIIDFDQHKLENIVDKFVNDVRKGITQVNIISTEDALHSIVGIKELFNYDTTRKN